MAHIEVLEIRVPKDPMQGDMEIKSHSLELPLRILY